MAAYIGNNLIFVAVLFLLLLMLDSLILVPCTLALCSLSPHNTFRLGAAIDHQAHTHHLSLWCLSLMAPLGHNLLVICCCRLLLLVTATATKGLIKGGVTFCDLGGWPTGKLTVVVYACH